MLENSCADYTSEYFNRTIPIESPMNAEQKSNSISKIESLLEKLKKAQEINLSMQNNLINTITQSQDKMKKIEPMLEKINSIKKPKPKKHMRYSNYIPLDCFYFYTPKRIHLYYHLLEKVFESCKKDTDKDENGNNNSEERIKTNRYNFSKEHDNILNKIIFLNEKNNVINWYLVSAEMNNFFNSSNNNKINNINVKDGNKDDIIKTDISNLNSGNNKEHILLSIKEEEDSFSEKSKSKKTKIKHKSKKDSLNITKKVTNSKMIFTPLICYVRYLETTSFYKYKKWNEKEDTILRRAILYYGPKNWQQISYCLDGRNNSQCFHRWMKGINPKIRRDKWSFVEDLTLGIALNKIYQKKKWSKIANHLLGRTDIQCRERWCNILDPTLEDVEWTNEEDLKLLNLYRKHGNKWSLIAKNYGNRTDNTCWRRWKYLTCINLSKSCGDVNSNNINNISGMSKFIVNKETNNNENNGSQVNDFNNSEKKALFRVINYGRK